MKNGGGSTPTRRRTQRLTPQKDVQRRLNAELAKVERAEMVNRAEDEAKKIMERAEQKVDWKLTDHGYGHVARVREEVESLIESVNKASLAERSLGHTLTDEDAARLKVAALLHDVGRGLPGNEHAKAGADYLRTHPDIIPNQDARDEVSQMVEMHSKTELRKRFGTADLEALVSREVITPQAAFKASLLRLADGLDADRRRAEGNTQGESYSEVKARMQRELSNEDVATSMAHWEGHRGIEDASASRSGRKLAVKLRISPEASERHPTEIAYKVLDVLQEVQTTPLRSHTEVVFQSTDSDRLRRWYNENREAIAPGLKGMDVYLEEADGG